MVPLGEVMKGIEELNQKLPEVRLLVLNSDRSEESKKSYKNRNTW